MLDTLDVAIIGAGFGGIGIAIRLQKETSYKFKIFERASTIGGTWRDNIYPGCGCDVPSHLYSFSFEPNPNWSAVFSKQAEILEYMMGLKNKYNLDNYIDYNSTIVEVVFEPSHNRWSIKEQNGQLHYARTVISAIGPLNVPNIPSLPSFNVFKGKHVHSSEWDASIDIQHKNVAIIGTGASAIQIVPKIASKVNNLYVFQRTAPWVLPKNNKAIAAWKQWIYRKVPFVQQINRSAIYWFYEFLGRSLFSKNKLRSITKKVALKHIKKSIIDLELQKKVTPDYEIGCKRRLPSDDYYPALSLEHVELVTDSIDSFENHCIIDENGVSRQIDLLIWATGFKVAEFETRRLKVRGLNQLDLFDFWKKEGPEAHWGTCIAGFPGLMFVLGPNTGLGHNSQLHIMESQFNYIIDYLDCLYALPDSVALDVKVEAQQQFNQQIQKQLANMVWSSGCKSWYLHKSGKNATLWPGHTYVYRKRTRTINPDDFKQIHRHTAPLID